MPEVIAMLPISFDAQILSVPDQDAAYVIVPLDIRCLYGRGRLPVRATLDAR